MSLLTWLLFRYHYIIRLKTCAHNIQLQSSCELMKSNNPPSPITCRVFSACEQSESHHTRSPAPKTPAAKTTARLPTTPLVEGTSPEAMLAALELLLEEPLVDESDDVVEVPFVRELSELMSGVKLGSEPKVAVTPVAFLHSEVCVPEPDTNLTVAH